MLVSSICLTLSFSFSLSLSPPSLFLSFPSHSSYCKGWRRYCIQPINHSYNSLANIILRKKNPRIFLLILSPSYFLGDRCSRKGIYHITYNNTAHLYFSPSLSIYLSLISLLCSPSFFCQISLIKSVHRSTITC